MDVLERTKTDEESFRRFLREILPRVITSFSRGADRPTKPRRGSCGSSSASACSAACCSNTNARSVPDSVLADIEAKYADQVLKLLFDDRDEFNILKLAGGQGQDSLRVVDVLEESNRAQRLAGGLAPADLVPGRSSSAARTTRSR